MCIVGVLARIDAMLADETRRELEALPGVSTFDLNESERIGVLIEADDVGAAYDALTGSVARTTGVLAAWPIYVTDDAEHEREPATASAGAG